MEEQCLLAVFAHPDDECLGAGGVLRKYSDDGVKTALICATRGETGEISDPALATPETLGQVREEELRTACRILGISDLSFLDCPSRGVADADAATVTGRIVGHIRRLRPQVVVTFDRHGFYGHIDHLAIQRLTSAAFHQAGDPRCYPAQITHGLRPYAPHKLYATIHRRSDLRDMRLRLQAQGLTFQPGGTMATIPFEEMGAPDAEISTVIPLDDRQFTAKLAARTAHKTQTPARSPHSQDPTLLRPWLGTEYFVRLSPDWVPGEQREHDLFADVNL